MVDLTEEEKRRLAALEKEVAEARPNPSPAKPPRTEMVSPKAATKTKPPSDKKASAEIADDLADLAALAEMARESSGNAERSDKAKGPKQKSLPLAAGLSLLGPVGWLYSAPWKEAVPAAAITVGAVTILPSFILTFMLPVALPASVVGGMFYAWRYNRAGRRKGLFLQDKPKLLTGKKSAKR